MRCTVSYCLLTYFNEFVLVFFLSANPVKDTGMFRTSVELSHNNIRKFSSVGYVTHVCLGVHVQVHNPGLISLKFHRWLELMHHLVILFILRSEKRQKHFFLLTHQVMFQHTYICVLFTSLLFNLFINILFRFSLRFLIYV